MGHQKVDVQDIARRLRRWTTATRPLVLEVGFQIDIQFYTYKT